MGIPILCHRGAIRIGTVIRMHWYPGLWRVAELDPAMNTFELESLEGHGRIPALLIEED